MSGLQQVHVRVNDAATGKPTPVRIRVTDGEGRYYAPFGRLTQFATGPNQDVGGNVLLDGKPWAYIDGGCEISVKPGWLRVQIEKGPEYRPLDEQVQLGQGKLALRFAIERWVDMRRQNWYSGDTRCHFIAPHSAHLEAQAEDLAVVNLLIRQTTEPSEAGTLPNISNLDAFSGESPCLPARDHLVAVNSENYHPELGSLGLLHCHRVVYPLTFGGPGGQEDWTLADWCAQCHRKAGLVAWTRTLHQCEGFRYGEPLVELLCDGQVDAFELTEPTLGALPLWYDLLNIGVPHFPLAGASGKDSNAVTLGALRTYVQLGADEEFTMGSWITNLRLGRSFVTNGPLIDFAVDGLFVPPDTPAGETLQRAGKVHIRAQAQSLCPFERLEIVCNGAVVGTADAAGQLARAALEIDVPLERSSWLAARCTCGAFAHTSPIYAPVDGKPNLDRAAAERFLNEVERMIIWCQTKARCPTPQALERLMLGFLRARKILQGKISQASGFTSVV